MMTIPKFYRWLSERYPLTNQRITGRVRPEFDNLYIDLNPIIDKCCSASTIDDHGTQLMYSIFGEICKIVQLIQPKKILYLSVDGISPNAKYNAIRQKTFLYAFNRHNNTKDNHCSNSDNLFDKNSILPGTEWMESFNKQIEIFIRRQITENSIWKRLTIIYDDYLCPEEASHKIMNWIRREKGSNDCDPNIRHCLYGLNTKYFVMALALHEIHFCLMSDQLLFGTEYKERLYECMIDHDSDESFQLLHISVLREYLNLEFDNKHNIENIVDDFVLLILLFENEYLPPIPSLDMEVLLNAYKQILSTRNKYMIDCGVINVNMFHKLLLHLSAKEDVLLTNVYEMLVRHYQRLSGYTYNDDRITPTNQSNSNEICMDIAALNENLNALREKGGDEGLSTTYIKRYYSEHFAETRSVGGICSDYLKTLEWILRYYYFGCVSWEWSYKYHYAPLLGDLARNIKKTMPHHFKLGVPLAPFEELLVVLPSESHLHLLPEYCFQFRNASRFASFLASNRAVSILIDTNYHLMCRRALPLLPFIDIHALKRTLYSIERAKKHNFESLPMTDKEEKRNTLLNGRIFRYDREKATEELTLRGPLSFGVFADVVSCIRKKDDSDKRNVKWRARPLRGARLMIPGFPCFGAYLKYSWCIKQIGLRAFGFDSSYETLTINITGDKGKKAYDGMQTVFIDWPYLVEAKVFYVETRQFIYQEYNKMEHTEAEMFNFDQRCLKISNSLLKQRGINVGVIDALVHCYPLVAMYRHDSKMKIQKKFSSKYESIPYQMVCLRDCLSHFNYFDSRFVDQKIDNKLEMRMGASVIYIGDEMPSLFGCRGKITSQSIARNGTINIFVEAHRVSMRRYPIRSSNHHSLRRQHWYSLSDAAEMLNVQKIVLKRILEHIFVIHREKKIQIGLRLFDFEKRLIVNGFTRIHKKYSMIQMMPPPKQKKDEEEEEQKKMNLNIKQRRRARFVFEISAKALQIVMEYRSKFPGVFRVIQEKPSLVTFGSHYFSPDQIPTNFNPYIVSRVVGVNPNGLSSNFQNILDSLAATEEIKKNKSLSVSDDEEEAKEEEEQITTPITPMSRLFSPRKPRFPHDLDNPSKVKWTKKAKIEEVAATNIGEEETVDDKVLSIRDAFKAQIHAAAGSPQIAPIDDPMQKEEVDNKESDDAIDGGLRYVMQVQLWLKQFNKQGLVDANSILIPDETLNQMQIELKKTQSRARGGATRSRRRIALDKVSCADVYAADPPVAWSPTPQRLWRLGDRCCSLRSDSSSVPFGSTGTVIGIHSFWLKILMDEACICGTNLSNHKIVKLGYDNVLNCTKSFHSYAHQDLIPLQQFNHNANSFYYQQNNRSYNNYNNYYHNQRRQRHYNNHRSDPTFYTANNTTAPTKKNNDNTIQKKKKKKSNPQNTNNNDDDDDESLNNKQQQLRDFMAHQPPYIPPNTYLKQQQQTTTK
eukprot:472166_1